MQQDEVIESGQIHSYNDHFYKKNNVQNIMEVKLFFVSCIHLINVSILIAPHIVYRWLQSPA